MALRRPQLFINLRDRHSAYKRNLLNYMKENHTITTRSPERKQHASAPPTCTHSKMGF